MDIEETIMLATKKNKKQLDETKVSLAAKQASVKAVREELRSNLDIWSRCVFVQHVTALALAAMPKVLSQGLKTKLESLSAPVGYHVLVGAPGGTSV